MANGLVSHEPMQMGRSFGRTRAMHGNLPSAPSAPIDMIDYLSGKLAWLHGQVNFVFALLLKFASRDRL
jgi:hypothetical protein